MEKVFISLEAELDDELNGPAHLEFGGSALGMTYAFAHLVSQLNKHIPKGVLQTAFRSGMSLNEAPSEEEDNDIKS